MAVVVAAGGPFMHHAASTNPQMHHPGYTIPIQHSTPPLHLQHQHIHPQAPYYILPHAQAHPHPQSHTQFAGFRSGSVQPQPQLQHYGHGPSPYTTPQPQQPLPPLATHNEVPLNRDQLITILEYFSTLVPSRFDNRPLRLIVHGGACMLLHPGLYALAQEHEGIASRMRMGSGPGVDVSAAGSGSNPLYPLPRRQTTRDVDYLHRAFVKDWEGMGKTEAEERLRDCITVTARAFGLGGDWMNSDADISLPMADDGKGKIFDPIHKAAIMPNNLDVHTVFTSKNQQLTLVSVAPVWSVALKLRRYTNFDPGDICLILKNGTKLNKVRWSESTLEGWLRKEAWPMGYHHQTEAEIQMWRARLRHAIGLVLAWSAVGASGPSPSSNANANATASTSANTTPFGTPGAGGIVPPAPPAAPTGPAPPAAGMFQHVLGPQAPIPRPSTSYHTERVGGGSTSNSRSHTPAARNSEASGSGSCPGMHQSTGVGAGRGSQQKMPLQNFDMNIGRDFEEMRLDMDSLPTGRSRDRDRERERKLGRHQRAQSSMGMAGTWYHQAQAQGGGGGQQGYGHQQNHGQTQAHMSTHGHSHSVSHLAVNGAAVASAYGVPTAGLGGRPSPRNQSQKQDSLDDVGVTVLPPTPPPNATPNPEREERRRREERDRDRTRSRRQERENKRYSRGYSGEEYDYGDRSRSKSRSREPSRERDPNGRDGGRSRSQPPARHLQAPGLPMQNYSHDPSLAGGYGSSSTAVAGAQAGQPQPQPAVWHSHPNPRPPSAQPLRGPGSSNPHLQTWHSQGLQPQHALGYAHPQGSGLSVPMSMPYGSAMVSGGSSSDLEEADRGRTRSGPGDPGRDRSRSKSQKRRPPPLMLLSPAMPDELNLRGFQ